MKTPKIRILKAGSPQLLQKAFQIREEVFVVEQQVDRSEEFDEFEETASHFVALNDQGEPIGAARWRSTSKGIKLERFVVKKSHRGMGIGSDLVLAVLADIEKHKPGARYLYLHAQIDAMLLYKKHGFRRVGEMFVECNIDHYTMERKL